MKRILKQKILQSSQPIHPNKVLLRTGLILAGLLLASMAVPAQAAEPKPASQQGLSNKPIPNQQARNRGCRDDGPAGVNRLLPSWVSVEPSDAPQIAEGLVKVSHVSRMDMPAYHTSHDQNFDVALDPAYAGLYSDADVSEAESEAGESREEMEMEWEINYFPPEFWPVAGDRVWMMGRWIFDCGHPPYRTEIHPPRAVAFTRPEPIFFAGDTRPSLASMTSIYVHGLGGYYRSPVANRTYEFDVILPPRPSVNASLRTQVLATPFGGPVPILKPLPGQNKVHVIYPLDLKDPDPRRKFAAILACGWHEPVASQTFRTLEVTVDSIQIHHSHDPDAGEWRLFLRVGSHWFEVPGLDQVQPGDQLPIQRRFELTVPEQGSLSLGSSGWESDCDSVFRVRDDQIAQRLSPLDLPIESLKCQLDENDGLGSFSARFDASSQFGIGMHHQDSTRRGDPTTAGDFTLNYQIKEITRYPAGQTKG